MLIFITEYFFTVVIFSTPDSTDDVTSAADIVNKNFKQGTIFLISYGTNKIII